MVGLRDLFGELLTESQNLALTFENVMAACGIVAEQNESRLFRIREDHLPGDLGFDPLGLKPTNDKDLKSMASKELNNGRLAMIGIAGMVAQELVSGMKI